MKRTTTICITAVVLLSVVYTTGSHAKGDDFDSVVKMIEQFYSVKHQSLPFLAKAGMKVVGTAAKVRGGELKRFAEAGSIKLATFEDQNFNGDFIAFRKSLNDAMSSTWMPLIQTLSATDAEQTYVFLREKGDKFNVLVVIIEKQDATVVQATVSTRSVALLMKDPEQGAKAITREATINDQE
jgi:hypothetical protein